jgi:hypothetical protein
MAVCCPDEGKHSTDEGKHSTGEGKHSTDEGKHSTDLIKSTLTILYVTTILYYRSVFVSDPDSLNPDLDQGLYKLFKNEVGIK